MVEPAVEKVRNFTAGVRVLLYTSHLHVPMVMKGLVKDDRLGDVSNLCKKKVLW